MITNFLLLLLCCIAYASLVEWLLHRFVMHRPLFGFEYAFRTHSKIHHRVFKADETYHLMLDEHKRTIPMAWWNSLVLTVLAALPSIPFSIHFHSWWISLTAYIVLWAYYAAYERIHWCMHLPKNRRIEMWQIFRWLNGHHLLHHRYMKKNFNVVFPLWDLVFCTFCLRSKCHFKQAEGPMIPNVQPRSPRAGIRLVS